MKKLLFIFSVIALLSCEKQKIEPIKVEEIKETVYKLRLMNIPDRFKAPYHVFLVYNQPNDITINITDEFNANIDGAVEIILPYKLELIEIRFATNNEYTGYFGERIKYIDETTTFYLSDRLPIEVH
jgi:hypothetical protein